MPIKMPGVAQVLQLPALTERVMPPERQDLLAYRPPSD